MKRSMIFAMAVAALGIAPAAFGLDTGNSTLGVSVGAEASISVTSSTTLNAANTKFGGFSGTTNFTYKIRTTETGGSGSITVQVTAFGTGGPAIADLAYTCSGAASGTPC